MKSQIQKSYIQGSPAFQNCVDSYAHYQDYRTHEKAKGITHCVKWSRAVHMYPALHLMQAKVLPMKHQGW